MSDIIFEHDLSEKFISIGPITVYWYSLMFLFAFWFGYLILKKIYTKENKYGKLLDHFLFIWFRYNNRCRLGEFFFIIGNIFKITYSEIFCHLK